MSADVFISIPSYADPDICNTVSSALAGAHRSVRAGVVLQDDDPAVAERLRAIGADVHDMPQKNARGCGWARAIGQTLWEGEPWYYQCDAHMRFEPGWDENFVRRAEALDSPGVLTAHPPDLEDSMLGYTTVSEVSAVVDYGFVSGGIFVSIWGEHAIPARTLSGANQFMPAEVLERVPLDPNFMFTGEESAMAVRFWTHGFDLWHPGGPAMVRHRYRRPDNVTGEPGQLYWMDHPEESQRRHRITLKRLDVLYGRVQGTLGAYGLGTARTIDEYTQWSQIDIDTIGGAVTPDADWRAGLE